MLQRLFRKRGWDVELFGFCVQVVQALLLLVIVLLLMLGVGLFVLRPVVQEPERSVPSGLVPVAPRDTRCLPVTVTRRPWALETCQGRKRATYYHWSFEEQT